MKNLFETTYWEKNKKSGALRHPYQGEPQVRWFLEMGEYAIADDGCVYQVVDSDDAMSFLIYDNGDVSYNYAEDNHDYSLISDGYFDDLFAEIQETNYVGKTEFEDVYALPIGRYEYFRLYAKEPGDNPADVSWDTCLSEDIDLLK